MACVEGGPVGAGLRGYQPEPHRNAFVTTVGGVDYVDDSKATNPGHPATGQHDLVSVRIGDERAQAGPDRGSVDAGGAGERCRGARVGHIVRPGGVNVRGAAQLPAVVAACAPRAQ